jgi:trehalose 6-phosphate synthase/phosphatase
MNALRSEDSARYREELDRRFHGRRLLLAVDRLDYTKGIPERLRTFRRLLQSARELRGQIVLIQVAVPSREDVAAYAGLKSEVNELVGEINGEFGTPDWTPLVYIRRGIPRPQLAALYSAAEVAWVTPLRDGMNLVAKEFVACKPEGDGALVLSEFAGAAEEMGEAFAVNPFDEESTAQTVARVLALRPEERKERMLALHQRVLRNNVFAWSGRFLRSLREAASLRAPHSGEHAEPLHIPDVVAAYCAARRRVLFLDYDGTLAPYALRPEHAVPAGSVLELLDRLAADAANCVVIISGRRRNDLERWFGHLRSLWLVAEHGTVSREPGVRDWKALRPNAPTDWKDRVRPVFEHFCDRTPGSLIEEKEFALVWHHRMANPEFGEWLANELAAMLEGMLSDTELRAVRGQKTVEVKPAWANKGEVVDYVLSSCSRPDFRFAIGDDRTDEDMFERLDADAWTVHVGSLGPTKARFALPDVSAVRSLIL